MKKRTKKYRKNRRKRRFIASLLSVVCIILILFIANSLRGDSINSDSVPVMDPVEAEAGGKEPAEKPVICIDPGHGGYDNGSTSITGVAEKDINLKVALKLGKLLEKGGFKVIYTRTSDEVKGTNQKEDLQLRCDFSNRENADIFISIHCNFDKVSPETRGVETWCRMPGEKGEELASSLQSRLAKAGYTRNRGLRYETDGELFVIKNTRATAVLVELGFLSNSGDSGFLQSEEGVQKCAEALNRGILDYYSAG